MKRLLGIGLIALAGFLVACGDDDEDATTAPDSAATQTDTVETPTIETPTAPTTPDETTAPGAGDTGAPSKPKGNRRAKKRRGERADLPKCAEIGGGPAPCRRPDGTVRIPEPL